MYYMDVFSLVCKQSLLWLKQILQQQKKKTQNKEMHSDDS